MTHFRLRTQLFVATLLIICGLTGALLLIIRHTVRVETDRQGRGGKREGAGAGGEAARKWRNETDAPVRALESVQRQREQQLSRTAAMLADLPTLKAQMTTEH